MCDRVGGQSLHEDLTGASFHAICHDDAGGYASKVDQSVLPPLVDGQPDVTGKPVPLATQQAQRAYGVARLERLAADRDRLVAALDAAFPDIQVPTKDLANPDPTKSCNASPGSGKGSLHTELANLLSRFDSLYADGTLPHSTEALGGRCRLRDAIRSELWTAGVVGALRTRARATGPPGSPSARCARCSPTRSSASSRTPRCASSRRTRSLRREAHARRARQPRAGAG